MTPSRRTGIALALLGLAACDVNRETGDRTLKGAAAGAAAGGVVGLFHGSFLNQVAIGTAAGAASGFVYDQLSKH